MPGVVDADTHVIESELIWELFDEDMLSRKPVLASYADPVTGSRRSHWLIDGKLVPKPPGKGGQALATPPLDPARRETRDWKVRELSDLASRLEDADHMGVDTQVIYPTIFIGYLTDDAVTDVALARSYNRFQADVWSKGGGRLRWVIVPPLHNLDKTMEELHFGKEHGAVGVLFRGIEGDKSLADPYFFPVYEEAQKLDLPICVHTGPGCPAFTEVFDSRITFVLPQVRMLPVMAFYDLVANKVPERFPDLRFGFVEANSSWVSYVFHFLNRRFKTGRKAWGPQVFRDYRLYVACESDEDLPYILRDIGEDNLMTGSDYGHGDPSADYELFEVMRAREDVDPATMSKIFRDNPSRFYGLK